MRRPSAIDDNDATATDGQVQPGLFDGGGEFGSCGGGVPCRLQRSGDIGDGDASPGLGLPIGMSRRRHWSRCPLWAGVNPNGGTAGPPFFQLARRRFMLAVGMGIGGNAERFLVSTTPDNVNMPPLLFAVADHNALMAMKPEVPLKAIDGLDPSRVVEGEGFVGGQGQAGVIQCPAATGSEGDATHGGQHGAEVGGAAATL